LTLLGLSFALFFARFLPFALRLFRGDSELDDDDVDDAARGGDDEEDELLDLDLLLYFRFSLPSLDRRFLESGCRRFLDSRDFRPPRIPRPASMPSIALSL
jgi:hypothetical protein